MPSGHRPEPAKCFGQENCQGKFSPVVSHKNLAFPNKSYLSSSLEIVLGWSWLGTETRRKVFVPCDCSPSLGAPEQASDGDIWKLEASLMEKHSVSILAPARMEAMVPSQLQHSQLCLHQLHYFNMEPSERPYSGWANWTI